MIVGGLVFARSMDRCIFTRTTYTLEVNFDDTSITKIEYKYVPDVPNYIYRAAFGNFRGRSLIIGGDVDNKCFHFDQEKYQVTPSLNGRRKDAASTFIQNKVILAGGHDGKKIADSIEILDWDESNHGSQWIRSPSRLPIKVQNHTMATCNHKLYVIGGQSVKSRCKQLHTIWEGTFSSQKNEISWVQMGLRLQKSRSCHFSFVISNQIIIFGGEFAGANDVVEIIEGNELKQGPKVPFQLDTVSDQAILDRQNRIVIISNKHGLILYDHQNESLKHFPDLKLREERFMYAAILQ